MGRIEVLFHPTPDTAVLLPTSSSDAASEESFDGSEKSWKSLPDAYPRPTSTYLVRSPRQTLIWLKPLIIVVIFFTLAVSFELSNPAHLPSQLKRAIPAKLRKGKTLRQEGFTNLTEVQLPAGVSANATESVLDEVCPGQYGCRFLLPTWVAEQESRAQLHFLSLAALATSLNRTLILPRVHSSRFGTCGTSSFDYLYKSAAFAASEGVSVVVQRDLESWLSLQNAKQEQPVKAQAVRMTIEMSNEPKPESFSKLVRDELTNDSAPCLDKTTLDFTGRPPLVVFEPRDFDPNILFDDLRALDDQDPADVLLVHYNLRAPLVPLPKDFSPQPFEYQPEWHRIADLALDEMGVAMAGVHWRTESIEPEKVAACGIILEDTLLELKETDGGQDVKGVYIASDFPLESLEGSPEARASALAAVAATSTLDFDNSASSSIVAAPSSRRRPSAHSDTLTKFLTPAHLNAVSSFFASYNHRIAPSLPLHTYGSLLPALLERAPDLSRWILAPDARAIVDLLVLHRTEIFLSGFPAKGSTKEEGGRRVCGKSSNWTRRVMRVRREEWFRQQRGEAEERRRPLRNVQALWSEEGTVTGLAGPL